MLTSAQRALGMLAMLSLLGGVLAVSSSGTAGAHRPAPATVPRPATTPEVASRPASSAVPTREHTLADGPVAAAPPLTGCPPRPRAGGGGPHRLAPPTVAESALPAPVPVRRKATDLSAVLGKGLWATPFGKTPLDVERLVAQARRSHVRSIWVRTGGSRQGYYGNQFLAGLIAQAHAARLKVIAWDFPSLSDPVADAHRARQALAAGVDGFSPDVEATAEGTRLTTRRLRLYLSLVRAYAGERPVIATVPRPPTARPTYPYATFVPYADVFAPMVYWSCHEPGAVVQQSIRKLRTLLPVAPIGQGYDMTGEGGRRGTPSGLETLRFLDAARRAGAIGASLWTVEQAGPAQLRALAEYRWSS